MFSSPYFIYILGAYGLSLAGLISLFGWIYFSWKRSTQALKNVSRETQAPTSALD